MLNRIALCLGLWVGVSVFAQTPKVTTATYLGGRTAMEQWVETDFAPDGNLVIAGMAPYWSAPGVKENWLMQGGGDGIVFKMDPKTNKVLWSSRIGDYITDMQVGPEGNIALTGSFGVAVLAADGTNLLWRDGQVIRGTRAAAFDNLTPPFKQFQYIRRVARVSMGNDGTVASLQAEHKVWGDAPNKQGHVYVYDKAGKRLADIALKKYKYPEDVTVDAANKLVIVGGFNTYKADSRHMKDHPIHMPFLTAYTYDGKVKWAAYDFPAKDAYRQNHFADSRVQRLAIGGDGKLYMGGYVHGGDHIWHLDPFDVKGRAKCNKGYDAFTMAINMGKGLDQAYLMRFDPATGKPLARQALMTRANPDGRGKPNQIQIRGLDADKEGRVFISGYCEAYIKNRDACKVAGQKVGAYHKPEAFALIVSPNFRKRELWTVFSKDKVESAAWGMAVNDQYIAMLAEVYEGEMITTDNAW